MTLVKIKQENVKYDANHDIMHVFFPPFDYSVDDEELPGIIIKRSIKTERITGLIIMDYSKRTPFELRNILPIYDFNALKYNLASY